MVASPEIRRRLVLVRLLLRRAEEDSRQSEPFAADSLNRLHDAAEMFLALLVEHYHLKIPPAFMGYWDVLARQLGRPLTYQAQMQKLTKARANLKHYGLKPTDDEIRASVAAARGLIEDECLDLFGVYLDDVSLLDVVADGEVRGMLREAQGKWDDGHESEAFNDLAAVFHVLVTRYRDRKQVWRRRSVFDSVEEFDSPYSRGVPPGPQRNFETAIIKSIEALDFNTTLVGLGIDLRKYGMFRAVTQSGSSGRGLVRVDNDYEFCRDFVIANAIHLAEFDYSFAYALEESEMSGTHRNPLSADENERRSHIELQGGIPEDVVDT